MYRRRRRGYYGEESGHSNSILLAEFMFYNKAQKIIDEKVLKNIEKKLSKKEAVIYWTNKTFALQKTGFKFYSVKSDDKFEIYIKILTMQNPFTPNQFNKAKYIYNNQLLFSCKLNSHQFKFLDNNISKNGCDKIKSLKTFNTWNEFISFSIKNNIIQGFSDSNTHYWDDFKEMIAATFGIKIELKQPTYEIATRSYKNHRNLYHVLEVHEIRIKNKNYRLVIVCNIQNSSYHYYTFTTVNEDNKYYNYYDKDRIFFITNNKKQYFLDLSIKEIINDKMLINLSLFYAIDNDIERLLPNENEYVITPFIYRFYKERSFYYDDSVIDNSITETEMKILAKYQTLLTNNKEIKIENTVISRYKIQVDGDFFSIKFGKKFLDVPSKIGQIKKILENEDNRYNFNEVYENLLKISGLKIIRQENTYEQYYKDFEKLTFKVNNIPIKVSKEHDNRIRINGIYCRINDVFHILNKAICFKSKEEFIDYVKDVSYIGVQWKQLINSGVQLQLENPFYNTFNQTGFTTFEKALLRFSLLWDSEKRSKIYLLLNGKKYLIKYKDKFKKEFNYPNQSMTLTKLKKTLQNCIENLDNERIIEIVENSIEEAKIVKERGIQLVKDTVKDIKAIAREIEIRNNKINGYYFKGRISNAEYFINKTDLAVYKKIDGVWNKRCVVDDHTKNRIFEDRLANRLVNIYNEPSKIYTIH